VRYFVLRDFPRFDRHLRTDASIVQSPAFQKAVVWISKCLPLSDEQRIAVALLLKTEQEDLGAPSTADSEGSSKKNTQDEGELQQET
jgi:hypothetical protein